MYTTIAIYANETWKKRAKVSSTGRIPSTLLTQDSWNHMERPYHKQGNDKENWVKVPLRYRNRKKVEVSQTYISSS